MEIGHQEQEFLLYLISLEKLYSYAQNKPEIQIKSGPLLKNKQKAI